MPRRLLPGGTLAVVALIAMLLSGCGGSSRDQWSEPHPAPTPVGTLGPGFFDPEDLPAPESTITPTPGSWDGVHPPKGYRVVLVTAGQDAQTRVLVEAIRKWAEDEDVDLRTLSPAKPDQYVLRISDAIAMRPDLIVTAGNDLVDPMALVTANHLDQQFLVVGAEIAEPTANVTAADWTGAAFRGEGLGMSSDYDPTTFTPELAGRAVRAGVAAVLNNLTGIVIWLE